MPETSDHDAPIRLSTMGEIRTQGERPFVGPAGSFSRVERIGNFEEFAGDAGRLEDFVGGVGDLERAGDFVEATGNGGNFIDPKESCGSRRIV